MNPIIICLLILALPFSLTSCEPPDSNVSAGDVSYSMGSGDGGLRIKTVMIEGNEYFATKVGDDHWALCPKLPPKPELPGPARPEAPLKP